MDPGEGSLSVGKPGGAMGWLRRHRKGVGPIAEGWPRAELL